MCTAPVSRIALFLILVGFSSEGKSEHLFNTVSPFFGAYLTVTPEAEVSEIFKLSRNESVLFATQAIQKNKSLSPNVKTKKIEEIVRSFEQKLDGLMKEKLAGKPLFNCALPRDLSKAPRLVFDGEIHGPDAKAKRESLVKDAEEKKIMLAVEAAVRKSPESVVEWIKKNEVKSEAKYPWIQGIEGQDGGVMGTLVTFAQAAQAPNQNDFKQAVTVGIMRSALMKAMLTSPNSVVAAYSRHRKKLTESPLTTLFDQLKDLNLAPNDPRVPNVIQGLASDGYLRANDAWSKFMFEMLENSYSENNGGKTPAEEKALLHSLVNEPAKVRDFESEVRLDRRNVEMALSLAANYCEALKEGKELHVNVGANHVYGIQRFLKAALPDLPIVYDFAPGTLKTLKGIRQKKLDEMI